MVGPVKVANDPGERSLEMLFRSALASALTFELDEENRGKSKNPEREKASRESVLKRIESQCQKITDLGTASSNGARRAYTVARAVAENARGWALYRLGQRKDAIVELRDAITLMPDFVDAYLNLAELLMKAKDELDANWIQEAQDQLNQVLLLSPSSQRAHYLLGRLFSNPAIGRYQDAKDHLAKAELIPWSYFFRAQILLGVDGDLGQAIQELRKSIFRFPRVDYRYVAYVEWVIKYADTKPSASQPMPAQREVAAPQQSSASVESIQTLLENARYAAGTLQKHGIDEKLKAKGDTLVKELDNRLKKISPKEADEKEGAARPDPSNSDPVLA